MACKQHLDSRCILFPAPWVLEVSTKTCLESGIKKFNPHFIYTTIAVQAGRRMSTKCLNFFTGANDTGTSSLDYEVFVIIQGSTTTTTATTYTIFPVFFQPHVLVYLAVSPPRCILPYSFAILIQ